MLRVFGSRLVSQKTGILFKYNRNCFSTETGECSTSQSKSQSIPDVPGVSTKVLNVPSHPVGFAGCKKDSEYKNPEYFCYHVDSFGESFVEMEKYRLPAPSNKAKKT